MNIEQHVLHDCCLLFRIDHTTLQHRDGLVLLAPGRSAGQQAQMLCGPSFHIRRSAHISTLVPLLVWRALKHVYDSFSLQLVTEVEGHVGFVLYKHFLLEVPWTNDNVPPGRARGV